MFRWIGKGAVTHVEWPAGRKSIDVGDAVISNRKIKEALGWQPRHDLKRGLLATRDYFAGGLDEYLVRGGA